MDAEADKERTVQKSGKDVGVTLERRSMGWEQQHNEEYFEWQKWKSNDPYDSRRRQERVKVQPSHTWTKRTQWNSLCRKTTYLRDRARQWILCEDVAAFLTYWRNGSDEVVRKRAQGGQRITTSGQA